METGKHLLRTLVQPDMERNPLATTSFMPLTDKSRGSRLSGFQTGLTTEWFKSVGDPSGTRRSQPGGQEK